MPIRSTVNPTRWSFYWVLFWLPVWMATGCKVTKNYPRDKPFVYKTTIKLNSKLSQTARSELMVKLENQVDDSLKPRWVRKLFVRQILSKPPVFDTANVSKSLRYLNDLLRANGYMYSKIDWDSSLTVIPARKQQRVSVSFNVTTGQVLHVDSIVYDFRDSTLQALALVNQDASQLKQGQTYTKESIARELDRLLTIYKNNGYLKIGREDIYAEVDTVVSGLLDPGLDPFEQLRLLEEVRKRRDDPKIDIRFLQRGSEETEPLKQYYFGKVNIYPDLQLIQDTVSMKLDSIRRGRITIFQSRNLFKPGFLIRNNRIKPGSIYREEDITRTNNTFGQMSAWKQVGVELVARDSLGLVDANINMFTAKKHDIGYDLEVSRNQSDIVGSSNLFGVGISFSTRDRNVARQSILSSTNLRFGIELGNRGQLIQTFQINLGQNFTIPKFVLPFRIRAERSLPAARTILSASAAYIDRRGFYSTRSLYSSIAYDWLNKKNRNWTYSPLNVEFVRVYETDSLRKLYDKIPNLQNLFNDGLIISQFLVLQNSWKVNNKVYSLRARMEESGSIFGMIRQLDLNGRLSRFVKGDIDFRYLVNHEKHSWAFRIFGGLGVPYGRQFDSTGNILKENNLPFFKSYFAGGPSSMRGWQIRQLGPGSSKIFAGGSADRFADIQLEGNIEYRFNLATIFGMKLKSAFFTDFGNIWYRNNQGDPELDDAVFKLSKLYRDIAMDAGTSLRFDFGFNFILRFDWAYKVKDPFYAELNNGWFHKMELFKGQFQLGINYPF